MGTWSVAPALRTTPRGREEGGRGCSFASSGRGLFSAARKNAARARAIEHQRRRRQRGRGAREMAGKRETAGFEPTAIHIPWPRASERASVSDVSGNSVGPARGHVVLSAA